MRTRPSLTLSICALAAALALLALLRPPGRTEPVADGAAADPATISIEGFAFSATDPLEPTSTVTVTNVDGTPHTLTAVGGEFDTGLLGGGATSSFTVPSTTGTYAFFCELHPSMTGSLTVS